MKQPAPLMERPAIPPFRHKTMNKRLAIITACIVAMFSLNASAADTPSLTKVPPAAGSDTSKEWDNMTPEQRTERRKEMRDHWEKMSPEERAQVRRKMQEHWKSMSPEQREARRKEMLEHFNNMSPEERQQFQRDMGKDGAPPGNFHPSNKASDPGIK